MNYSQNEHVKLEQLVAIRGAIKALEKELDVLLFNAPSSGLSTNVEHAMKVLSNISKESK